MQIKRKKRACRSNVEDQTANKWGFIDRDLNNIIQKISFNRSKISFSGFKAEYFTKALYLFLKLLVKF